MQDEIASGLSLFEQKLASTLTRIEIRGKRGRKVPVLLTMKHKERIDCLLKYREQAGVSHENPFLFPRSGNVLSCLRSCDVLRKFARKCGASQPDLLSSTSLRKHIATISQILNLKNHELDALAGFLGHDINVHRNFYRLPEDTVQLAKVGKILHELNNGRIAKHKGKSLDEIEIADDEEIDSDQNDSDNEDQNETISGTCSLEDEKELRTLSEADEDQPQIKSRRKQRKQNDATLKTCSLETGKEKSIASHEKREQPLITSRKKQRQQVPKRSWSEEERAAINRTLLKFFTLNRLPGKNEILDVQRKEPILQQRPWQQIKFFIKNMKNSPNFIPL
ncbi:hypothetical protein ElyMa_006087600 [Elysia marginata]|uniref:Uncharacterized protein n=1 Tax=Elysia marginata TaxID=1093978 RepID=A0AAV4GSS4_9GAST|nr:hypothetical protein ElyMa_006087600 [Elysia marginata]